MTSAVWWLQVENEDLIFTLETLVERFDEEMAPYAVGLTQHLAAAFWRMQVPLLHLPIIKDCLSGVSSETSSIQAV